MSKPAVAVVIPFYNRSRFAERLFRSIIAQTLRPETVYIVDNGSSVQELAECRRIAEGLDWGGIAPNFLRTERSGNANYARNLGMQAARGRYIAFVDSDDWWEPRHLELSLERLQRSGRAGVYAGAIVHRDVVAINASRDIEDCASPFELLFSDAMAQTSSYVLDMEQLGPQVRWDERLRRHQDFDFFLQVHYGSAGWTFLPTPCTHVDWDQGGAKGRADHRSMVRFRKKWGGRHVPDGSLRDYAYLQLLRCYELQDSARYKRYYRRLYLGAAGGQLVTRMRTMGCYMAAKGFLHRHGVVRRIETMRRSFLRA